MSYQQVIKRPRYGGLYSGFVHHSHGPRNRTGKRTIDPVHPDAKRIKLSMRKRSMPRTKYRKRNRRRRRGVIRKRLPSLFVPKSKVIRCKITHPQSIGATGTLVTSLVSMTDITDPFLTSGGGQPLGYDQWAALYSKAKVIGSKVKLQCHNSGSTAIMWGICPRTPNSTALTAWDAYQEVRGTKVRMLSPDVDHGYLSSQVSNKKFLKWANLLDKSTIECNLVTGAGPILNSQYEIFAQAFDQTSVWTAQISVTVEYIVLLYDYITPARSSA